MSATKKTAGNGGVNLAVGLLLSAALLRYMTGLELFSPLYVALAAMMPLIIGFGRYCHARPISWILLLLLALSVMVSMLNFGAYSFRGLFYALTIFISAWTGLALANDERVDLFPAARVVLLMFFAFFAFKAVTVGYSPEMINLYLANSSRNAVAAIVIFLQLFYCATYFIRHAKFPKVTPVITLLICLLCFGRSGVLFGIMLVLLPWVHYFFQARKLSARFITFMLFILVILPVAVVQLNIVDRIISETNFEGRGFESPRIAMYEEYVSDMSLPHLILGRPFDGMTTIERYEDNPHNSFILGHHFMGLPFLAWFLLTFFITLSGLLRRNDARWLFAVCILFMGRTSLDILSLPGLFDIIFFYVFFYALKTERFVGARTTLPRVAI